MHEIIIIKPDRYVDDRGFFSEVYNLREYSKSGISDHFVQDNHSLSTSVGTIRGLHFQSGIHAQSKLIRCVSGAIYDVAVDIRLGSPTYGNWKGCQLSGENGIQMYIPIGFAHGFVSLQPNSQIVYKCSNYYSPEAEGAVRWDSCGINWPLNGRAILSEKDANAPGFDEFESPFIFGEN
jgi:dTDP-4-dehydrorhamnose 3,5-epimerase